MIKMIKEYTTATGSKYLVDGLRVNGTPMLWVHADGRLVFAELVIEGDPPVIHLTRTSPIVGVRDVPEV